MKINKLMQLLKDNAANKAENISSIRMESTESDMHLYVYDVIDSYWGANAADLVKSLASAGDKTIHLHINSPGGDVFEARAMAAALVAHKGQVISHIDGMTASAATYLALAANEVRMTDGGLFMVHNSWTMAMGDRTELRQTADLLEKIDGTIASDYANKTGATAEQVAAWMDAETWFTAQEAMNAGFIDAIDPNSKGEKAQAKWNLSAYANAPEQKEEIEAPDLMALSAQQIQMNKNRLRLFQI
ncbi:head maturation protease, ClpP-related [Undibacterium sp. Di24W]|uniref:head maturation protease, ClpP-related n=1 Tax=Undibacterium sp. Di24W TaxID=3413033 RepID=UPI003BF02416